MPKPCPARVWSPWIESTTSLSQNSPMCSYWLMKSMWRDGYVPTHVCPPFSPIRTLGNIQDCTLSKKTRTTEVSRVSVMASAPKDTVSLHPKSDKNLLNLWRKRHISVHIIFHPKTTSKNLWLNAQVDTTHILEQHSGRGFVPEAEASHCLMNIPSGSVVSAWKSNQGENTSWIQTFGQTWLNPSSSRATCWMLQLPRHLGTIFKGFTNKIIFGSGELTCEELHHPQSLVKMFYLVYIIVDILVYYRRSCSLVCSRLQIQAAIQSELSRHFSSFWQVTSRPKRQMHWQT